MPRETPSSAQPTQNSGLGAEACAFLFGAMACWRAAIAAGDSDMPAPEPGINTVLLMPPPEASMAWVRLAAPAGGEAGKLGAGCP